MQIVRQLEVTRWKTFVDENPCGNIFHTPEMFEVFSRTKGHQPSLWVAIQDDGEILALLPAVKITLFNGPLQRLTTRAVAFGGVLCAPNEGGRAALGLLLDAYKKDAGNGALFTEFRNMSDMGDLQLVLQEHGFVYEDHLNLIVDLTQPQETIWRNISRRKRENVNSIRKKERVEEVTGPEGLGVAYRLLQDVYARVQIPLTDKSMFEAALDVLAPRGMFRILIARAGEHYAATILLLTYHGRILYWYIGADRSSPSSSSLLVWHAMQWGKENGYDIFDFGGGGKPGQEYGPREFKSRFGGVQVNYGRNVCVHSPARLKVSQVGYQFYRRVFAPRQRVDSTRRVD
jgi:hypothetical protein